MTAEKPNPTTGSPTTDGDEPPPDLAHALNQCQAAAQRGYDIAKENLRETSKAIDGVSSLISQLIENLKKGKIQTNEIIEKLKAQLIDAVKELVQLQRTSEIELEDRRKKLDRFSITLFGRTMAGKSTLMEILTRGEGHSIGTGAQRTTRDVRVYTWNGLEVTDVPGIAAFEGAEDEELAFKAASQADLVLFLITDDGPQPVEAAFFARLCRLGKPILGICNLKVAVDEEDDLDLFLKNPDRTFDRVRLDQMKAQFQEFVDQHVPGKRVDLLFTHLRARFLANHPQYAKVRDRLLAASRFEGIETRIVREVVGRGAFLRVKNFVDEASLKMMNVMGQLLDFAARNSSSGRIMLEKWRQLGKWAQQFRDDGKKRIHAFVSKEMESLRNEVPYFSEKHCEDGSAGEEWNKFVVSTGINQKVKQFQKELFEEYKKELSEVARELESELSFVESLYGDRRIKMDGIFDTKRAWRWAATLFAGGIKIVGLMVGGIPGEWAATVILAFRDLTSTFFEDRTVKTQRAQERLRTRLSEDIDKMERRLRRSLQNWFNHDLLKHIYVLLNNLSAMTSALFRLADAQRTLAWTLNDRQKALARTLVENALIRLKAEKLKGSIVDIARVPGVATMFLIAPGTKFPDHVLDGLKNLLDEKIWFVIDTKIRFSIFMQAIGRGCDRKKIRVEEKIRVAHIPIDDLDSMTEERVRLAQQLTGLHVMG